MRCGFCDSTRGALGLKATMKQSTHGRYVMFSCPDCGAVVAAAPDAEWMLGEIAKGLGNQTRDLVKKMKAKAE